MSTKTTAVIADDHPVVLAGLAPYLAHQGIEVIAIADSVNGLLSELKKHAQRLPDIVITSYGYGGEIDGLRLIERVHRMYPEVKIVVFTGSRQNGLVRQLLAKGADAFIGKSMCLQFVVDALPNRLVRRQVHRPYHRPEDGFVLAAGLRIMLATEAQR